MKPYLRAVLLVVGIASISGCATYSQVYVNAAGQIMQCSASGAGLIPMAMASNAVSDCGKNMRAAGYLEIDRAGVIGVYLADGVVGSHPRVLKVTPGSPADSMGVMAGDLLVRVEGQDVTRQSDASVLLFGEAGTKVTVEVQRAERDQTLTLVRASYSRVYGQKTAETPTSYPSRRNSISSR